MRTSYHPRPGSLADRVLKYLNTNPKVELTRATVADFFNVSATSVFANLETAIKAGVIEQTRNDELEYVYRLPGRRSPDAVPPAPVPPSPDLAKPTPEPAPTTTKRGAVSLPASALDFSGLKAEVGVPLTGKQKSEPGVSKWQPLIDLLTAPDTSVEFPAEWKSAVAAQTTKLNVNAKKAGQPTHYKVRLISQDKARIWRVA